MSEKRLLLGRKNAKMGYSAAYPTGRERIVKGLLYHGVPLYLGARACAAAGNEN